MFIGEISESHNRGTLGCTQGVFIASGLLFSYLVGPYLTIQVGLPPKCNQQLTTKHIFVSSFLSFSLLLQLFCLLCAIPPTLFLICFWLFVPETPYYLVAIKDTKAAHDSLAKYRGKTGEQVEKELLQIISNVEESFANKATILDLFRTRGPRKALTVTVGLVSLQQFFGVNVILSYMQTIFSSTGSTIPPEISSIVMGIVQVVSVVMAALCVDRLGRRILLLVSAMGACLAQTSIGLYFYLKVRSKKTRLCCKKVRLG